MHPQSLVSLDGAALAETVLPPAATTTSSPAGAAVPMRADQRAGAP